MQYATISVETFKKYWSLVQAAMKGFKPIRNYEGFVLMHGSVEHGLVLRLANETGGLRINLGANEQPSTVIVMHDFEIAIQTGEITKVLPHLGKGVMTIESVEGMSGVVAFVTPKITQHVPWSETVVDDFPGDTFFRMSTRLKFNAHDFDRKVRLAKSSATTNPKLRGTLPSTLHITVDGTKLTMQSATDARGISYVVWEPDEFWSDGQPFSHLIPIEAVDTLARAAAGFEGVVEVAGDPGGNMLAWTFGQLTLVVRSAGEKFFDLSIMFTGKEVGGTSVPYDDFKDVLALISAQTPANTAAKAIVTFEAAQTFITSPSTTGKTEATIGGLGSGNLPATFTMNARQIKDILGDMRTKGVIHLSSQTVTHTDPKSGRTTERPILMITSPTDPDFRHVAILISTVKEAEVERVQETEDEEE